MRRLAAATAVLLCWSGVAATGSVASPPSTQSTVAVSSALAAAQSPTNRSPAASRAAPDEVDVTIESINTYLERREPIEIDAVVENTSNEDWTDMQAYLVISQSPLTDRDSLVAAAESPPETYSGDRVTDLRAITRVGTLKAGDSQRFTVRVPFKRLVRRSIDLSDGVYQVGVQVLATDEDGNRDRNNAIGRARTFLPYLDPRSANDDPIEVSMVWPFTTSVRRAADGTYPNASELIDDISDDGRLGRMLTAARDAVPRSITVLLDPALIDALATIASGSYGPPEDSNNSSPIPPEDLGKASAPQQAAADFLDRLRAVAGQQDVWMTPYAQPDLDGLAQYKPRPQAASVYQASENASRNLLNRFGVKGRVAYMPPKGTADLSSLRWAQSHTDTSDPSTSAPAAILAPEMLNDWSASDAPLVSLDAGDSTIPTVVDDGTVMSGGPLPGQADSALQVRQRLASAATMRAIERTVDPSSSDDVAVVMDPEWDPGPDSEDIDLFDAMSATWVTPVSPERQLGSRAPDWRGPVGVPQDELEEPIPDSQVEAAAQVVRSTNDLLSLLDGGEGLRDYYGGAASMIVSQNWRSDSLEADAYASDVVDASSTQLNKVTIEGPGFVSFSGNSGQLPITIHNGLDEPVTVGVAIQAKGENLSIPDMEPREIAPGQSPSFTIDANIGETGNTAFTAILTTPEGEAFGEPATFNVRSSVVGTAIWIGMGVAGLLVVVALVRRFRKRRAASSLTDEAEL